MIKLEMLIEFFLYRLCNILKIDYEYMTRKKIGTNTIPFTYLKSLLFIV